MPDAIHPLLMEEEQKAEEQADLRINKEPEPENMTAEAQPEASSESTEEQKPEQPQPEETQQIETPEAPQRSWVYQDDPNYIVIDRRQLGREYVRLFNEDKDFRGQASTTAGRAAKREAQRRIEDLEAEVSRLARERRSLEVQGMSQEDIAAKMADDPVFAREYTDLLHPPDPTEQLAQREAAAFEDEIDDLWEEASVGGLAPTRIAEYQRAIVQCPVRECPRTEDHGFFDHNPSRSEPHRLFQDTYGNSAPAAALAKLQSVVRQELTFARNAGRPVASVPPPPPPKATVETPPAGAPNPKLTNEKPDTSGNSSRNGRSQERLTREDVRQMSVEERIRRWPESGDYERDVREGRVLIPGLNDSN